MNNPSILATRSENALGRIATGLRLFWAGLFLMLLLPARAQSVSILDASFDIRYLSVGSWSTTLTPWQETNGPGNSNGFVENISGFSADGSNHLGMSLNHNVWQDLGINYQANSRYTLTVAVGNRSGQTSPANQSRYILADSAGTVYATGTYNASAVSVGKFADAPALVFETGASSAAIGKTIRILLQAGSSGRSHFDKIRLTEVSLLAPTATTGAATGVTEMTATLAGTAVANGQSASVAFEYGLSTAYGQTLTATPSAVSGAAATSVIAEVSNLAPSTTYHYRLVVTAGAVTVRGTDRSFTTAPASVLGLSPSSFSLGVRSGEVASLGMAVENTGAGAGSWSLEVSDINGRSDSLEGALAAIDASGTALNGPLPNRYDFTGGETGAWISGGAASDGLSVFAGGNMLNTSVGGGLAYSNGTVTTSAAMGAGGSYFTRKLPGLFVFGGEFNGPSWFEVSGYIQYGYGTRQTSEFSITRNGKRWSAFVVKMPDYWRTINHLILVDQEGLVATTGTSSTEQKHRVSGLTGKCRLFYLLYVASTTTMQPDSVFEQLAGRLLDTVPPPFGSMVSVSPASGTTVAGGSTPVTLTANATGVEPGTYPLALRVKKAAGEVAHSVNGSLEVTAPRLSVPASVARTAPMGMAPFIVDIPLTTSDSQAQSWSASIMGNSAWLALDKASGTTPEVLKIQFSPGSLAVGTYRSFVRVTSGAAVFEIPVTLVVSPLSIRKFLPDPLRPSVYALNQNGKAAGELLEIDAQTKQIKRLLTVGSEPSDLDLTDDGSRLVVMNTTNPSLTIVDLSSFTITETIPLAEFSNRNEDVGGHVKCGKGSIVYYVDEQWGPRLRVFDTAARTVLQTLGAQSGTSPNISNDYGYGDIQITPSRDFLFGWVQFGDGAGWAGTAVVRLAIGKDGTLSGFDKSSDYYQSGSNFGRDPLDTPVLITRDARLIIKDRLVDKTNLNWSPIIYPDEIYSVSPGGEVVAGPTAIYPGEGGEVLHTLAVPSTVQAILPDYSNLIFFNSATKAIGWLDLPATLGNSRLGLELSPANGATVVQPSKLKWTPVTGIYRYQIYLGTNRTEVEGATPDSPLYRGLANGNELPLTGALLNGQTYYWRVVPVDVSGTPLGGGTVYSFTVSPLTFSRSSIAAETVQGVVRHLETIDLSSADPQSWTATESVSWIKSVTPSGTTPGTLTVELDATGLGDGIHQGALTVSCAGNQVTVPVSLRVYAANLVISEGDLDLPYIYLVSQADVNSTQPSFLLRLNTATDQIESAIPCGSGVTDLAVHYFENRIYLTNWKTGILRAFDRTTFSQVQTYQFSPSGAAGYSNGDAYVVAAGRSGRVMVEEEDQWVDAWLVDTATGNKVATQSTVRQGGGVFDPLGRYYFHGEDNSSGAALRKLDTSGDKFAELASKRVDTYSYYGSRLVAMSGDGSRVFWNGGVFDPALNILFKFNEEVVGSTYHGELLFTNTKAINGANGQTLSTLPVNTKVQAVSGDQKKLYLFSGAAVNVVNLSTIATVPPRGLIPGIPDGSVVIGTSQELSWSIEATAHSYDVYFGTSAAAVTSATTTSPEYLGNASGTQWTGSLPALSPGATYYWRVDTNGFSSTIKGSTWSFAIARVDVLPRSVKLASPAGAPVPRQSLAMSAATATAWTASTATPWITLRTTSGTTPGSLEYDINTTGLTVGSKAGSITFQSSGQTFTVPVELSIVTLNVTQLLAHPNKAVVYGINTALAGEGFSHLLEIDAATAAIQRTLPIGFAPTDAALDAVSGKLYIANNGYSGSKVVDVNNWSELPSLPLGDTAKYLEIVSGGRLAMLSSQTIGGVTLRDAANGSLLGSLNEYYNGNIAVPPSGDILYLAGNGTSGSKLRRYRIGATGFTLDATGPQINYGSENLVMSGDGKRLFWQGRTLDENMGIVSIMPSLAEIYSTNRTGELAIGESAIWWSDSGTQLATLPYASKVAAVSVNDAYLVRFNAANRTLTSNAISTWTDLPGPWPRPGQILEASPQRFSWTPVTGATGYRIFIAADAAALQAMTTPTATVTTAYYDLATPLPYGRYYSWRVDLITGSGVVSGKVQSFSIRFLQGPAFATSVKASAAAALSVADGKVLLGWGNYDSGAQVFNFNSATGATEAIQSFSLGNDYYNHYFGSSVAVDRKIAAVGAYARANPASSGGNVVVYMPGTWGYWEQSAMLAPPSPVANEGFGKGIAASGNLMLAGTSNAYSTTGRVVAYITEPSVVQTQVFSASDGAAGDGFGNFISMDGNRALISAPGSGSSYNRIPCLYAFTRSTATGLWTQSQKITIPGATSSSSAGTSLALNGSTMAVRASASSIAVFNETGANQWTHSVTINSSSVSGASSFGTSLALHGDLLFVGDSGATYQGTSGGAVYVFRRNGATWTPGPVITPSGTRSGFGTSLAAREGWLLVAGSTDNRPASVFRIDPVSNRIPRFANGGPAQLVAGRSFSIPLTAEDADGNTGLVINKLQGPSWLALADNGNGNAVLSGTPVGASGTTVDAQFEVRDSAGAKSWWTTRITLLAPTDLPVLTQEPVGTELGVGQDLTLRAAVSGIGPFQWQWYFNGNPIPGATRDSLVISEVTPANAGRYQVRVSNAVGEDTSAEVALTVHAANRYAGDWPTFGSSPSHTGRHPAALGASKFVPAWSQTLQSGYTLNRAAIAGGRAVVVPSGYFDTELDAKAVDLSTGRLLWSFPFPSSFSSNPPSIYKDRVYFQRGGGVSDTLGPQLICLNTETGAQVWASSFAAQWESYEAPAISDQGVYMNGGYYGGMYGFNFDGSQKFFQSLSQNDGWTPTILNGRVFSCVGGAFSEHSPADGSILWSLPVNSGTTVAAISGDTAVMAGNGLTCLDLLSRSIRWTIAATITGSAAIGDGRAFAIEGNKVRSYALADGSPGLVYQTTAPTDTYGIQLLDQPIIFNDRLAISSDSKTWIFNLADGRLLQTLDAGGRLSYSNSYLLMAGTDGILRAFRAVHDNANLASLSLSAAPLDPRFDQDIDSYAATVPHEVAQTTVTPVLEQSDAAVAVNGAAVAGGTTSQPVDLAVGNTPITVTVTAEDGVTIKSYRVVVSRLPQEFYFGSESDVPLTAERLTLGNWPASIRLGFSPRPGTVLTMIRNTGLPWIHGRFSNLAQGQRVSLPFGGKSHDFTVDYHGGTGNDLVLQWADTTLAAWGANGSGQLGDGTVQRRLVPTPVADGSALEGRTIKSVSAGYLHSLALTVDGSVAAWGASTYGQTGSGGFVNVPVPAVPDPAGVLSGRTVVAVAAGSFHNLVLCADGSIAAWGYNNHGQLGDGTRTLRRVPVIVPALGALTGKRVISVAAGAYQSFALCDDGSVVSWGYNEEGELGDGTTITSPIPVAVKPDGVLSGRKVIALAAGQYHVLALCSDGGVVAWGYNNRGQIGDSTITNRLAPVDLRDQGDLTERTVVDIAAGGYHSMALCSDGGLVAWGYNHRGQLGFASPTHSASPLLAGNQALGRLAGGANHSLLRRADGTLQAWGENSNGQLGDGTLVNRANSADVDFSGLPESHGVIFGATGSSSLHGLAIVAIFSPSAGIAASSVDDPDMDGLSNLIEYAFGLDPNSPASRMLPQPRMENGALVVSFVTPEGVTGITYGAEWSETLDFGSWKPLDDTGSGMGHRFAAPVSDAGRAFIRLKVTSSP